MKKEIEITERCNKLRFDIDKMNQEIEYSRSMNRITDGLIEWKNEKQSVLDALLWVLEQY